MKLAYTLSDPMEPQVTMIQIIVMDFVVVFFEGARVL